MMLLRARSTWIPMFFGAESHLKLVMDGVGLVFVASIKPWCVFNGDSASDRGGGYHCWGLRVLGTRQIIKQKNKKEVACKNCL